MSCAMRQWLLAGRPLFFSSSGFASGSSSLASSWAVALRARRLAAALRARSASRSAAAGRETRMDAVGTLFVAFIKVYVSGSFTAALRARSASCSAAAVVERE